MCGGGFLGARRRLRELAQVELGHKEKLLAIMEGKGETSLLGSPTGRIEDLKIVDFLEDTTLSENADYQAILIYAAKREKNTYEHYRWLATGPFARYFPQAREVFSCMNASENQRDLEGPPTISSRQRHVENLVDSI